MWLNPFVYISCGLSSHSIGTAVATNIDTIIQIKKPFLAPKETNKFFGNSVQIECHQHNYGHNLL